MNEHETFEFRLQAAYLLAFERYLVQLLEQHLGRVPTNDEVAALGHIAVWPSGQRSVQWAGKPIGEFPSPIEWAKTNQP